MDTLNIAFVCYEAFLSGGISIYTRELVSRLASSGHSVALFSPPPRPGLETQISPAVRLESVPVPTLPLTSAAAFGARLPFTLHGAERKNGRFDIIHSNTYGTTFLPRFMTRGLRITTVHHLGTSSANSMKLGFLRRVRHPSAEYGPAIVLEGLSLRRADHLIAISEFTRNDILGKYTSIPAPRVSVIYHGATPRAVMAVAAETDRSKNLWGIENDKRVLLYVGRLEERKGISFLLRAFSSIVRETRTKLLLVGPGEPRPYQIQARSLSIDGDVIFAGRVDERVLNAAYSLSTALVHPAAIEGFGLAIADAVASGIPVVSTRAGAIPEIVRDGIDGYLVNYGDTLAFADAIRNVLGSRTSLRNQLTRNEDSRFSWEKTCRETLALYERLMNPDSSS